MKTKKITSWLLVLALFCGFGSAFAATTPGSQQDPLISKSYIDSTYSSQVMTEPYNLLKNSMVVLRYKLSQASGNGSAPKGYSVAVKSGEGISLIAGAGFNLLSGGAKLTSCTGTFLDLTDGSSISVGQALAAGHRYLAAENTSAVATVTTASKLSVLGDVSIVPGTAQNTFSDVPGNAWYHDDVYYAVSKGLVNGKSATSFEPESDISIAETIKLAACMHQLYNTGSITLKNSAAPEQWYNSYVQYALTNGIISGSYGNYDAKISRGEFVSIFYASMPNTEYTVKNTVSDNKIPDVKLTDSYAKEIYAFYRAGILIGSDGLGNFYSANKIKRSEVSAVLTRMYEKDARKSITLT